MAKISIVIPTYNSSSFIKRSIQSVLNQTFTDWELLVVDDCSTDDTIKIVDEFIKNDSRIKLFKTPSNSGGPATPKNIGLKNAQGEYVAFLDHDDEWFLKKLEKQLKFFETSKNKKLGFVACFFFIKNNTTNKILSQYKNFYQGNIIEILARKNFIVTSSCVLVKLKAIKEAGEFDKLFKVSDDWDMWLRISALGYEFDFVPEYLLNYFVHNKNACYGNENFNETKEFVNFYEKHQELFLKYNYYGIGYYYFSIKNNKLSRKYFIHFLLFKKSDSKEKLKSLAYIILSFFPAWEKTAKKIWRRKY